jgi:hypothetical protein
MGILFPVWAMQGTEYSAQNKNSSALNYTKSRMKERLFLTCNESVAPLFRFTIAPLSRYAVEPLH